VLHRRASERGRRSGATIVSRGSNAALRCAALWPLPQAEAEAGGGDALQSIEVVQGGDYYK
jgi:hypothetical protein